MLLSMAIQPESRAGSVSVALSSILEELVRQDALNAIRNILCRKLKAAREWKGISS